MERRKRERKEKRGEEIAIQKKRERNHGAINAGHGVQSGCRTPATSGKALYRMRRAVVDSSVGALCAEQFGRPSGTGWHRYKWQLHMRGGGGWRYERQSRRRGRRMPG